MREPVNGASRGRVRPRSDDFIDRNFLQPLDDECRRKQRVQPISIVVRVRDAGFFAALGREDKRFHIRPRAEAGVTRRSEGTEKGRGWFENTAYRCESMRRFCGRSMEQSVRAEGRAKFRGPPGDLRVGRRCEGGAENGEASLRRRGALAVVIDGMDAESRSEQRRCVSPAPGPKLQDAATGPSGKAVDELTCQRMRRSGVHAFATAHYRRGRRRPGP